MPEPFRVRIDLQPIFLHGTRQPAAWHPTGTVAGIPLPQLAAGLPADQRPAIEAWRIGRTIDAAVHAGIVRSGALLLLPIDGAPERQEGLLAYLFRAALAAGLSTEQIVVEASAGETADAGRTARLLDACGRRGLATGLGDFAAGPVGLGLLARFTPRLIRLDPSLGGRLEASPSRARMVKGVVRLAQRTGATVIAPAPAEGAGLQIALAAGLRHFQGVPAPRAEPPRPRPTALPFWREPRRHMGEPLRDAPVRAASIAAAGAPA